jgi:plastocyanin
MRHITSMLALVLVAGTLMAAGCGGGEEEAGGGGATTPEATEEAGGGGQPLTLTADPGGAISWEPEELSAPPGTVTITLVNESDTPHAVEVEGNGVEEESETITGGETELTVDLKAGEYVIYCPVGQHREQGMEGTLTVE